eukprot:scaffold36414_cov20-Prasinocladus_malaysianus.AAC.1
MAEAITKDGSMDSFEVGSPVVVVSSPARLVVGDKLSAGSPVVVHVGPGGPPVLLAALAIALTVAKPPTPPALVAVVALA